MIAFADPEYRSDSRAEAFSRLDPLRRTRGLWISDYFEPIPETRSEVEQISQLFDPEPVEIVMGRRVTESYLKTHDLTRYRYVHLATHGILGDKVPGLEEPALVLSEEDGKEDGYLTASEAEDLDLDADLTVLSACSTGAGEYVTGEGVLAMGRAFLIAGSRSVVVSLWDVDSRATEELMVAFYRRVISGEDPVAALGGAKRELIRHWPSSRKGGKPKLAKLEGALQANGAIRSLHPYYWAAFTLIGG